jgi:hypothetical protein
MTEEILIEVPEGSSNYRIGAEYKPYCVWLFMEGRVFPMPIGNKIYPYKHDQLEIGGTIQKEDGKYLILKLINKAQ